jgi:hypothetical protein
VAELAFRLLTPSAAFGHRAFHLLVELAWRSGRMAAIHRYRDEPDLLDWLTNLMHPVEPLTSVEPFR